jgi:hypothetical protein
MRRSYWIAGFIAAAVPFTLRDAQAAPRIAVVADGVCPGREAVISALAQAMPDVAIVADGTQLSGDAEAVVVISDGGVRYRTIVRGIVRTLVDEPSDCLERARKVAVVAALALEPPPSASAAPEAVEVHPSPSPPSAGIGMRVEGGAVAEYASLQRSYWSPFADMSMQRSYLSPFGGTVRLTVDRGLLGVAVGGTLPTRSLVGTISVQRIPLDVSVQLRHRRGWIAGGVELGPSIVLQRSKEGRDRWVRLETDLRMSGRIEIWFKRDAGVFAAITGTYVPNHAPLMAVDDDDQVAMPTWWFGASAGLTMQIW